MKLTAAQRDRACGVLLGTAAGDALGAGYEFDSPMPADAAVDMIGGGLGAFERGEWTDDTSMAIAIAETAATGVDLRDDKAQDQIVKRWSFWAQTAKDIGVQTSAVLSAAKSRGLSAQTVRQESEALHRSGSRTAGNGSLMRTAAVALTYIDDEDAMVEAARTISELTHFDPDAGDACVLWCLSISHAILTGEIDVRVGLRRIPAGRRDVWSSRLDEAESSRPSDFARNGWVVQALQGAWSAIINTPEPEQNSASEVFRADRLRRALEAAVRGGHDTDTVAAIAGGLLGAAYGASAVPARWRLMLHGWPGLDTRTLVSLADRIIDGGEPDGFDYTYSIYRDLDQLAQHPYDNGLWIGGVGALSHLPNDVNAIVSLCRVADVQLPSGVAHLDVRLIDRNGDNDNLDFVLLDTVKAVEQLRAEGRTVFLHCVQAQSRTPTAAALYGARRRDVDIDTALGDVAAVLPGAHPIDDFRAAMHRLRPVGM